MSAAAAAKAMAAGKTVSKRKSLSSPLKFRLFAGEIWLEAMKVALIRVCPAPKRDRPPCGERFISRYGLAAKPSCLLRLEVSDDGAEQRVQLAADLADDGHDGNADAGGDKATGTPTADGVERLAAIWRGLRRQDVFPITWRMLLGVPLKRDFLVGSEGLHRLVHTYLPYRNLQDAKIPVHIVATDILSGEAVVLSEGPAALAIIASTAIPAAFAPVKFDRLYLADGAITSCTPVKVAVERGARRLIVLPTGYACAREIPPQGAVAKCAASAHLADHASNNQRARKPRRRNRILRRAAVVPADRITLRLLADERAHRACRD
jgi:hypothetical protein